MANTLTAIIPSIIANFQYVLREKASLPRMVNTDYRAEPAALNQTITIPQSAAMTGYDITPAATPPALADTAITNTTISITKSRGSKFHMTGEDYARAASMGADFRSIQMQQAFRTLVNEVHSDLAALNINASLAIGTAGTSPFASDASLIPDAEKLLNDSLAPFDDNRMLFIDTAAKANLSKLASLLKVNEAGSSDLLRDGIIARLDGFNVVWDQTVSRPAIGTGANYVLNGAHSAGATSIIVKTGTGTILAGDVITINSVKYVVGTGLAAPGTLVINGTAGLVAAGADGDTVTVNAISRRNMAFHRDAISLIARLPKKPDGGDMAVDQAVVQDPLTGLSILVSYYKGYHSAWWEAGLAWGVKTVRPDLLKLVLG